MGQPSDPITADGQVITNGVTSGADLLYWRDGWYPHELGHSLGLNLYGASIPGRGGWTRPFSLMDLISGSAPGYMGYSRWILQWLDDSQAHCIRNDITLELTPLALKEGSKLAIVPLTPSTALVAEVRQAVGYDYLPVRSGRLCSRYKQQWTKWWKLRSWANGSPQRCQCPANGRISHALWCDFQRSSIPNR